MVKPIGSIVRITRRHALSAIAAAVIGWCAGSARADDYPIAAANHVEALCRSWTESPCLLRVAGNLRSAESGGSLAGMRLRFVSEGNVICTGTTDHDGRATCVGIVRSGRSVAESGYRIYFDGEGRFAADSADGISRVNFRRAAAQSR